MTPMNTNPETNLMLKEEAYQIVGSAIAVLNERDLEF
jgi:hypothetical protein